MSWSIPIAKPFGIDVKVHLTFFIIVAWAAFQWAPLGLAGATYGALLVLALFFCIALHELGHAVAARFFGIPVRQIVLLPIGGVAQLDREPNRPLHELVIAAAGPAVNVVIAIALVAVLLLASAAVGVSPMGLLMSSPRVSVPSALAWLLQANIALVLFNLIPAFPLDGGRIFRATLGFFMPWYRATRIAGTVGQALAVALGLFAIFTGQIFLTLIAVLVFASASAIKRQPPPLPTAYPAAKSTAAAYRPTDGPQPLRPDVVRVAVRRVQPEPPSPFSAYTRRAG